MITSRHNTFGCWFFFLVTFFFLSFLIGEVLNHYNIFKFDLFINMDDRSFYSTLSLFSFFSFLYIAMISAYIKKIDIDTINKTVSFKNIITRQTEKYDFTDFDGIADTYLNHKGLYKTIGLVKDRKVIHYIDSYWVSNYDDLRESLQGLKCLGTYNFGTWKQLKLILRQPVID